MEKDMQDQVKNNSTAKSRISKALTRAQDALAAKRQEEEERRKAAKEQLAELERAAAVEAALNRKAKREALRKLEMIVKERLGRMVLARILDQGLHGTLLTAEAINSWPDNYRNDLHMVLETRGKAQADGAPESEPDPSLEDLDIDLSSTPVSGGDSEST